MKISCDRPVDAPGSLRLLKVFERRRQSGSALLVVLILLGVMGTLVVSNSVTLRRLQVELQLLEEKQNRALQARPLAAERP